MTAFVDERTRREFGPFTVVSEREGGETFHVVSFPDGRQLRILPDAQHSGQKRSRVVVSALTTLQALVDGSVSLAEGYDPVTYLVGCLARTGLAWEEVSDLKTVSIGEWLTEWFDGTDPFRDVDTAGRYLVDDLKTDGWEIVRAERV